MDTSIVQKDPVKEQPDVYKVLLDNDRVRILEVTLKPGQTSRMHSHPAMVIFAINDGKARFKFPDGKVQDLVMEAGDCIWSEATTHEPTNTGDHDIKVLNIEFKK